MQRICHSFTSVYDIQKYLGNLIFYSSWFIKRSIKRIKYGLCNEIERVFRKWRVISLLIQCEIRFCRSTEENISGIFDKVLQRKIKRIWKWTSHWIRKSMSIKGIIVELFLYHSHAYIHNGRCTNAQNMRNNSGYGHECVLQECWSRFCLFLQIGNKTKLYANIRLVITLCHVACVSISLKL